MRINPKPSRVVIQVLDQATLCKTTLFDTTYQEVVSLVSNAIEAECGGASPKWTAKKRKRQAAVAPEPQEVAA